MQTKNLSSNFSKNVILLNETMTNSLKKLENNFMDVNNTLTEAIKILRGEIFAHKVSILIDDGSLKYFIVFICRSN